MDVHLQAVDRVVDRLNRSTSGNGNYISRQERNNIVRLLHGLVNSIDAINIDLLDEQDISSGRSEKLEKLKTELVSLKSQAKQYRDEVEGIGLQDLVIESDNKIDESLLEDENNQKNDKTIN